jgi:hypothetical protein
MSSAWEYPIRDAIPRDSTASVRVRPVDEGVTDPDFFIFRARLQAALVDRDTAEILRIVDLGIRNSFGGDGGTPYVFDGATGDPFETQVVLGSNIPVLAGPGSTFRVIDTVSFEEVTEWRGKNATGGWNPIQTSKGRTGWVLQRYLRSPVGYRAGFARREGRWWLNALVAGD